MKTSAVADVFIKFSSVAGGSYLGALHQFHAVMTGRGHLRGLNQFYVGVTCRSYFADFNNLHLVSPCNSPNCVQPVTRCLRVQTGVRNFLRRVEFGQIGQYLPP